ncbi:TetR family transcriptional regulator [Streptomyces tardus]|uniref:TetR family transcriptional regulator n=1 Tax=Streptomyces tardus TaxID=2780544 RepID=UPI0027E4B4AE|nr:TetR family transcriptional regulator [Streptomyces tardus]
MSRTTSGSREAQKQRTRQAMLDAALGLLEDQNISSLGLREVTRAVDITPAAFYRHFRDIPDLGVALVEEALDSLHTLVRTVLDAPVEQTERMDRTVRLVRDYVREHPAHIRFVMRERHSGVRAVRLAIASHFDRFVAETAEALAEDPGFSAWDGHDREMLAGMLVEQMVQTGSAFLTAELGEGPNAERVAATARDRHRLILLGAERWQDQTD